MTPNRTTLTLKKGTILARGRFEVIEPIAETSLNSVFKALDRNTGDLVAIKTPITIDDVSRKLFVQEGHIHKKIGDRNLFVPFVHLSSEPVNGSPVPYLVTGFVDAPTLARVIAESSRRLSPRDSLRVALQLVDASIYLGDLGYSQTDLKPGNLFLVDGASIKMFDFGGVQLVDPTKSEQILPPNSVIATPDYMVPEYLTAKAFNGQVSVNHVIAIICAELLTGQRLFVPKAPIFDRRRYNSELIALKSKPVVFYPSEVPAPVRLLVDRTLSPDPTKRPQTFVEFGRQIQSCMSSLG